MELNSFSLSWKSSMIHSLHRLPLKAQSTPLPETPWLLREALWRRIWMNHRREDWGLLHGAEDSAVNRDERAKPTLNSLSVRPFNGLRSSAIPGRERDLILRRHSNRGERSKRRGCTADRLLRCSWEGCGQRECEWWVETGSRVENE